MPTTVDVAEAPAVRPATGAERRVHPRLKASELRGLVTARVKYGGEVRLLDLSVGGALVEGAGKLSADSNVVFELAGPSSTILVPSRALRVHSLSHVDDSGRYEGAFAFKRPIPLMDLIKEPAAAWQRIVARYRDGRIVQGYTNDFQPTKRSMRVSPTPFGDVSREVSSAELDTIFFLRDSALGVNDTSRASQAVGRRVAVTLLNGETLVGTTLNYRKDGNGFFVHPTDSVDTLRVFVTPWAVRSLAFL